MANEFSIPYPTSGAALYVVIRRASDAKVWNTSSEAFETFADANIGDYDILLTSAGGDLWTGDFPTAIAAGVYHVFYYVVAVSAAAITDNQIAVRLNQAWNGAGLSDAGDATLSPYALTTLTKAKRYLHITGAEHDALLTELINAMSDKIERIAGRKFAARDYVERYNEKDIGRKALKQFPVIRLYRVATGADNALSVTYTGSHVRGYVCVTPLSVVIYPSDTIELAVPENEFSFDAYETFSDLATAIDAVTDWSATSLATGLTNELLPLGSLDAADGTVYLTYSSSTLSDVYCDYDTGIIERTAFSTGGWVDETRRGFRDYYVAYRAGYETIPDDLDMLCRELVAQAFNSSRRDTSVISERIGNYEYATAESLADQANITEAQRARLSQWCDIAMGSGY